MNDAVLEAHEIKSKLRQKFSFLFDVRSLFYYVILLVVICVAFFFSSLISEYFTTPFSGDYAQQAYAFYYNAYDDWWSFFKTGSFPLYDSNTFLGADNIQANTYYGLFTPFLIFLLIFPRSFLPHAMVLMSIGKLVCGALLFRLYLKKMGAKEATARVFAIAYAFMGWTTYYLWFSTFLEVVAFFPLILLGIEKVIKNKKCWVVALGFFCIGVGNYFFLLTFGIFGVIYAGFRFFQTLKERKGIEHLQVICLGFAGFFFGICMCAAITFPALFSSFRINRAETSKYLPNIIEAFKSKDASTAFKMIFTYWHPYTVSYYQPSVDPNLYNPKWYYFCYSFPLVSYLFPAVSGRYVNIVQFSQFENVGSSIFIFTPCMLLMIPSLIRSFKNKKVSHFIALLLILVCLFTPFVYWLSGAFANSYGRWQIVVSTTMITYVALNFDHREEFKKWQILLSGALTILFMVGALLLANKLIALYAPSDTATEYVAGGKWSYLVDYTEIKGIVIYQFVIVAVEFLIFYLLNKPKFSRLQPILIGLFLIVEVTVQGNAYINFHSTQSMEDDVNWGLYDFNIQSNIVKKINENDKSFFRMNTTKADEYHPNLGCAENFNGVSTFHTFYNTEVDDFVHMTALTNHETSWSAINFAKHAYLDEFLGIKYYMTDDTDTSYLNADGSIYKTFEPNLPLNYELKEKVSGYRVYENTKQINLGFSTDTLFYKHRKEDDKVHNAFYPSGYLGSTLLRNEAVFFEGVILNDEDLKEVVNEYDSINAVDAVPTLDEVEIETLGYFYGTTYISRDESSLYFNPDKPTSAFKPENIYNPETDKDIDPTRYQIVLKPTGPTFPIGSEGGYYMIDYPYARTGGKRKDAAIWLIDEEDKVVCFDDGRYNSVAYNEGGIYRGFYSKTPIKYIVICPLNIGWGNFDYQTYATIYYQPWEKVLSRFDKAISNQLENVHYETNKATFTTNYETNRFVCTQLAYTKGWKLKAKVNGVEKNLKIYNSQGGFVGFVAPKGSVSYELTYQTDGLVLWSLVSTFGVLGVVGVTVVPIIIKKRKEKRSSN